MKFTQMPNCRLYGMFSCFWIHSCGFRFGWCWFFSRSLRSSSPLLNVLLSSSFMILAVAPSIAEYTVIQWSGLTCLSLNLYPWPSRPLHVFGLPVYRTSKFIQPLSVLRSDRQMGVTLAIKILSMNLFLWTFLSELKTYEWRQWTGCLNPHETEIAAIITIKVISHSYKNNSR